MSALRQRLAALSLRRRITLAATFAVAAVCLIFGPTGYLYTKSKLYGTIHQQLRSLARPYLEPHPDQQDSGSNVCRSLEPTEGPPRPLGAPTGYFQSVCPDGTAVPFTGSVAKLPVTPRVKQVARTLTGAYFFTAEIRLSGAGKRIDYEIYVVPDLYDHKAIEGALPLTTIDSTLHGLMLVYIILIGGGILLAGLIGTLIGRAALRPINRFTQATERVTSELEHPRRLEEIGAEELRRLAKSFNQTLTALERSVEAQKHLIADASHELRTPMAALRSNIQIFLEAERLPAHERVELQQAIMAELDELTQLVSDVLELARGAGTGEQIEQLELDTLVREAIERAERRAPLMHFEASLEPTVIENSPERVSRAVVNVIDNARKWSPEDGTVEVTLRSGVLTVRDHGPGFKPADLEHVFDRFYRSEEARRMPGSGLGLSIVKQAAEAHGGFAAAGNAPDGGALVTVSFGPGPAGGQSGRRRARRGGRAAAPPEPIQSEVDE